MSKIEFGKIGTWRIDDRDDVERRVAEKMARVVARHFGHRPVPVDSMRKS
jgi:hypothetical protein